MRIPEQVIRVSSANGIPAPLAMAVVLEISSGLPFWRKANAAVIPQVCHAAEVTKIPIEEIAELAAVNDELMFTFDFDRKTWEFFALADFDLKLAFMLSCRIGLGRQLGKDLTFSFTQTDAPPIPVESWLDILEDFSRNTEKQLEILFRRLIALSEPKNQKETGSIHLGVSRLFYPNVDREMPITHTIFRKAEKINKDYLEQQSNDQLRKKYEAKTLADSVAVPDPSQRKETPKSYKQTIGG